MPHARRIAGPFTLPRIPRITVLYSGQEVYLNPLGFLGSLAATVGGVWAQVAPTYAGQTAGLVLAYAGLVTACGAILVPLGNKTIDMLMVRANFKGQLAEMTRQLTLVNDKLASSEQRATRAEQDRDRLQASIEKVQVTAEHSRQENRELTQQSVDLISSKIDSTVQKTPPR